MFRNWIRVDRLMVDLIPHLGPGPAGGGQSVRKAQEQPQGLDSRCISGSQPTWLTPAYLRQHRSGDRISRFR
ncbi:MAG: hypothetical protein RLZZ22_414 [Pseudomonadota bacterium]|jgi:hypothetical protein